MNNISYSGGQLAQLVNLINQQEPSHAVMGKLLSSRVISYALSFARTCEEKGAKRYEHELGLSLYSSGVTLSPDNGGGGSEIGITEYVGVDIAEMLTVDPIPVSEFIANCEGRFKKRMPVRKIYSYAFNCYHSIFDVGTLWSDKSFRNESPGSIWALIAVWGKRVRTGCQSVAPGTLVWKDGELTVPRIVPLDSEKRGPFEELKEPSEIVESGICLFPASKIVLQQGKPIHTTWVYEAKG